MEEQKGAVVRPDTPPLPSGTKPLSHQVAGMRYATSKSKYGFLQLEDGTLLKPVQKQPRGNRELKFYQDVFDPSCKDLSILKLRKFVAKYLGLWTCPEQPGVKYIHMEDVTHKFKRPCIADIKVGSRRLDPETPLASGKKKKYHTVWELGYQLQGLRIYHPGTETYKCYDKKYGKTLKETTIIKQGLGRFLNNEESLRKDVAKEFVNTLMQLKSWFQSQRTYVFYSTSVLLVYEGATLIVNEMLPKTDALEDKDIKKLQLLERVENENSPLIDVRLIDFAFVFPSKEKDESSIEGLTNLINAFKHLSKSLI